MKRKIFIILSGLFYFFSFKIAFCETETYKQKNMYLLKIYKNSSAKIPSSNIYLKVEDIKDGIAYIKLYSGENKEKIDKIVKEPSLSLNLKKVAKKVFLYKKDCKTDKILEKKEIDLKSIKQLSCWSKKEFQCQNSKVYTEEICETYVFPVLEFGKYYTEDWLINVSLISDNFIVFSFVPKKFHIKKAPVFKTFENSKEKK
ncbi:MAG: hypothetical protein GXO21_08380 [Aquificae bacterium]|nr:hypothetical protein [Aquificota bacterium]